jgi:hypothetical protein
MKLDEISAPIPEHELKIREIRAFFESRRLFKKDIYTIHSDASVTIHVPFFENRDDNFAELPFKVRIAEREFRVEQNKKLITLNNFPDVVRGMFSVTFAPRLVSLENAPHTVLGSVDFEHCSRIISAKGCPQTGVESLFFKDCFALQSLVGCPTTIKGNFDLNKCIKLKTLEGCPEEIGGDLKLFNCQLHSLKYLPKVVKGTVYIPTDMPATDFLRLLKIKETELIRTNGNLKIGDILTKHLDTRDAMECQEELIEAGLERYARI